MKKITNYINYRLSIELCVNKYCFLKLQTLISTICLIHSKLEATIQSCRTYLKLFGGSLQVRALHVSICFEEDHEESEESQVDVQGVQKPFCLCVATVSIISSISQKPSTEEADQVDHYPPIQYEVTRVRLQIVSELYIRKIIEVSDVIRQIVYDAKQITVENESST